MNVTRYNDSGTTHKNGIDGIFCVRWFVTPSNRHELIAASATHKRRSRIPGAGRRSLAAGACSRSAAAAVAWRTVDIAVAAQRTTKTTYAVDHETDCRTSVKTGSIATG